MLDMGFQPQVDRIVAVFRRTARRCSSRRRSTEQVEAPRAHLHQEPFALPGGSVDGARARRDRHRLAVTADTKLETLVEHVQIDAGSQPRLRTDEARRRRLRRKLGRRGVDAVAMHGDMSQPARERASAAIRDRQDPPADRDRRGGARARPARRHAGDQLRSARGGQGLRPPHGPHRPRRQDRDGGHVRPARAAGRTPAASPGGSGTGSSSRAPVRRRRRRKLVYTSRRGAAPSGRSGPRQPRSRPRLRGVFETSGPTSFGALVRLVSDADRPGSVAKSGLPACSAAALVPTSPAAIALYQLTWRTSMRRHRRRPWTTPRPSPDRGARRDGRSSSRGLAVPGSVSWTARWRSAAPDLGPRFEVGRLAGYSPR